MADKEGADLQAAWEKGTPAEVKRTRPPSSVLSIRVPSELIEALSRRAKTEGKPASILAREIIERGLTDERPMTPPDLARAFSKWVEELARPIRMSIMFTTASLERESWISGYASLSESTIGFTQHLLRAERPGFVVETETKTGAAAERAA